MEFGKLSSVDGIDFRLPDDHPQTRRVLGGDRSMPTEQRTALRLHLGTAGWSDKGFVGKLYPWDAKPAEFVGHYARTFQTTELNTTYYGVSTERLQKWAAAVPVGFRFCPKFPAEISHEAQLFDCEAAVDQFIEALGQLGTTLGIPWLVLPPAFSPERHRILAGFLSHIDQRIRLAIELRHSDWFVPSRPADRCFDLLREHGVTTILTDVAGRRDVLHQRLTASSVFLRFVGNAHHPSDFTRLDAWTQRLSEWKDQGLREAHVFLHEPHDHQTVELAQHWIPRLNAALELQLPNLEPPAPRPEQGSLF